METRPVTIALLVLTDGRIDYLEETLTSAEAMLPAELISERWMHDDSGDSECRTWLERAYPEFRQCGAGPRRGFGGAIERAWTALEHSKAELVLHLEGDFTFNRPVPLDAMATVLGAHPYLVQLALRRQPWNDTEAAAGGIVESHPEAYVEMTDKLSIWLEHRLFFTTNPSLYRRSLCAGGWPDVARSEGMFTQRLLADPDVRFGFWGARDSGEWITHIGHHRAGSGY